MRRACLLTVRVCARARARAWLRLALSDADAGVRHLDIVVDFRLGLDLRLASSHGDVHDEQRPEHEDHGDFERVARERCQRGDAVDLQLL